MKKPSVGSGVMADDLHNWGPLVDDVRDRKDVARGMGGPDRIARQRELGKLPVRERLDLLLDKGTFVELGLLADHMDPSLASRGSLAADGVVTGIGDIDGRRVAIIAYDFTGMAGSLGQVGQQKTARI